MFKISFMCSRAADEGSTAWDLRVISIHRIIQKFLMVNLTSSNFTFLSCQICVSTMRCWTVFLWLPPRCLNILISPLMITKFYLFLLVSLSVASVKSEFFHLHNFGPFFNIIDLLNRLRVIFLEIGILDSDLDFMKICEVLFRNFLFSHKRSAKRLWNGGRFHK